MGLSLPSPVFPSSYVRQSEIKMKTITAIIHFVTFLIICSLCFVEGAPNCAESVAVDLDTCVYGITRDWCNRRVCAKGPGEPCGGYYLEYGSCGDGMYCLCNQCNGCSSLTLKCYYRDGGLC